VKLFRPLDAVLILVILGTAVGALLADRPRSGSRAEVYVEGHKVAAFQLDVKERTVTIDSRIGPYRLTYGDGAIRISETHCPQKICQLQGTIRHVHERLICLPGRLEVVIIDEGAQSGAEDRIDAFSY
jgi:hypothetical protein